MLNIIRQQWKSINNVNVLLTRALSAEATCKKTAFYDFHVKNGGKMVPFAGYYLPVQYDGMGVLKEHLHTRSPNSASVFDVSHMGQIVWRGPDAIAFLEKVTVADIKGLKNGESKLSVILNEKGGIVDDTVITRYDDHIYMVVNGACKEKDVNFFQQYMQKFVVSMELDDQQQLLALQGDGAKTVLARLAPNLNLTKMAFMSGINNVTVAGIQGCRVTRCGYTGEDGFEISVRYRDALTLANALVGHPEVKLAGLGSRDSLRLEAGLCLYGHDLNEEINPVEGSLAWVMGGPTSRRRKEQGFLGASNFLLPDGKLKPVQKKRVGLAGMKAPAREHTEIFTADGSKKIGEITSGGFGPSFKKPLAMGYVATEFAAEGTTVAVSIRGNMTPATVSKMPFVPNNYYRVPQ